MHKTEGADNVAGLFADGPPGTVVEDDWLNAVQNEIRNYIEGAGLTLKTAGTETGNQLLAAHIAYGAASNIVTYASGVNNYSKPSGLAFVKVTVTGGGGGGGGVLSGAGTDFIGATGGGGGGTSIKIIMASSLAATETVTVGGGGTGGAAGNNHGNTGSTSRFGGHCTASGGVNGRSAISGSTPKTGHERAGGIGSGGDINYSGHHSTKPVALGAANERVASGGGGASFVGGGAIATRDSGIGVSALGGSGGGGGGGSDSGGTIDRAGGDGGSGRVTIEEYF